MGQVNALRSVLCRLDVAVNPLPNFLDFSKVSVKLFWPLERISSQYLLNYWVNTRKYPQGTTPGWICKLIRIFLSFFFFLFFFHFKSRYVSQNLKWVEGEGSCLLEQCWGLLSCLWQMLLLNALVLLFNVQTEVSPFLLGWNNVSHWWSHFLFLILCHPQRVVHKTLSGGWWFISDSSITCVFPGGEDSGWNQKLCSCSWAELGMFSECTQGRLLVQCVGHSECPEGNKVEE